MTVDSESIPTLPEPVVLRCAAASVLRGDQVAFVSTDREHVAGQVTARRTSLDQSTVALVVDNCVHFVPSRQDVVAIRLHRETPPRDAPVSP